MKQKEKIKKDKEKKQKKIKKPVDKFELSLNTILKPLLFVVFAFLFEAVNFYSLGLGFLPKYIFFDLGVFLIFASIIFISHKNWLSNVFFFVFLGFQVVLNILNSVLMSGIDDVFYFKLISLVSEGITGADASFVNALDIYLNLIVLILSIFAILILDTYGKKKKFKIGCSRSVFLFIGFYICFAVGMTAYSCEIFTLKNQKEKNENDYDSSLYEQVDSKINALKKFGTYGYLIKDFYNTYLKGYEYEEASAEYASWVKDGETEINEDAALFGENVILICMESADLLGIDPYNTPTLWNLCYGEGSAYTSSPVTLTGSTIFMENFYGKNKTNISEGIGILGYAPNTTVIDTDDADALSVKYSLANLFKEVGYETNYFHSYNSSFYRRETVNLNYGFENLYFLDTVDFDETEINVDDLTFYYWISEVDYFNAVKEYMIPTDGTKFFSYYMTVSAHGNYDTERYWFENYIDTYLENYDDYLTWLETETNYTYPEDETMATRFDNYKLGMMDLDAMVAEMISYLEETGLMETTTIVLYADHDCYYHGISSLCKTSEELYNIPLIIYNGSSKIESQIVSDFCSTYDIYPTICSLFGLAINTNMCQGTSIFTANLEINTEGLANAVFYSTQGQVGYFNLYCKSTSLLFEDVKLLKEDVTDEMIENFLENAKKIRDKQIKLNFIYNSHWTVSILE